MLMPMTPVGTGPSIVRHFLDLACTRPGCDLTVDDLLASCAEGRAQLVGIFNDDTDLVAAGVTQVRDLAGGGRTCWVLAVGGAEARAWRHTLREIEDGARRMGCASVEFVGRRGWARLLPEYEAAPCEAGVHYLKRLA